MGNSFIADLRSALENIASALFPFALWMQEKDTRFPPPKPDAPWRAGGEQLAPAKIGAIDFFEALLWETAADAVLIERFQNISNAPLQFSPLADAATWRRQRGLDPAPSFGAAQSDNLLVGFDGRPISRMQFYADYWPLLKQAAQAAVAQGTIDWTTFTDGLLTDQSVFWPTNQPLKSSNFAKQLARDLLYAMMDMRNDAPEPWKFALLIELAEGRRVGNAYVPADTQAAVDKLKSVLAAKLHAPPPPGPPVPPHAIPAVGSPRVGSPHS
jgi:hypothetical protein